MKNYVIINGVNSLTITGLAISKLPSISKPPLRVMTEEINGRDGDLITELGYGAYDKELVIGLYGNYDINEVIGFFNQEGTIVFSNEDDKYYNFKIINQIDYEALIKFRTATISLHCQPFKYPLTETPEEIITEYVEEEGETLTLNDTKIAPLSIDLKGNTSQNGTPTPSSPIDVNVVSGDNEVVVCGKNLFDKDNPNVYNGYFTSSTPTMTSNANHRTIYIPVAPNTTYTIQKSNAGGNDSRFGIGTTTTQPTTGVSVSQVALNNTYLSQTITTNATAKYLVVWCYFTSNTAITESNLYASIQIEVSSSKTTYEPYTSQNYPISLGTNELCKIGTYQDYIYKDNGKWYLHKEIGKHTFTGAEYWDNSGAANTFFTNVLTDYATSNNIPYSIYYKGVNNVNGSGGMVSQNNNTMAFINISGGTTPRFYVKDTRWVATDYASFKTWLTSNNLTIYYALATPTNTEITNTTLINQLEQLKGAMSYEGQTNISQVNNDLPFILKVKGTKEGSGEGIINNIGNIYAKPIIALEGTGNIGIYKNGTQYFEVDMSSDNEITIDTEKMEAYHNGVLKNRKVIGDYNKFTIDEGNNNIEITGELTKATISNYTRWL